MSLRLGVLLSLFLCVAISLAQPPVGGINPAYRPYRGYSPYGAPYGGGYYGGGGTVAGSQMHGMADLVRSSGYANLQNSEAAINREQARSAQLDNRLKYAQTYYERRRIRAEAKEYDRNPMTQEKAYRLAQAQRPDRLTDKEYDPATGKIAWPRALRQPIMNGTRARIEQLFAERSVTGHLSPDTYYELVKMCEFLDKQIGTSIREETVPMQDASQAKAFIKRLAYEARMAAE